jgi:uncharacterized membrane protein
MYNRPWFKQLAREQVKANLVTLAVQMIILIAVITVISVIGTLIALFTGFFTALVYESEIVIGLVSLLIEIVSFLLFIPLGLSFAHIYLEMTNGNAPKISDLFYGYSSAYNVFASVKLGLLLFVKVFLWSLLLIVPGIIRSIDYSQAFFILAENPEKGASQCIRESIEITRGHRADLFVMNLSFILWSFVTLIPIAGGIIFYCYVYPYMLSSYANSYRFLVDEANTGYYGDPRPY